MSQPPPLPFANPYAAPSAPVETWDRRDVVPAGRGARLGAAILDNILLSGPAIGAAIFIPTLEKSGSEAGMIAFVALFVTGFLVVLGFNLYYLHRDGQTLAKKAVGIRILRSDASRCELWRIVVLRFLPVSLLGAIPVVGFVVSLVDALMIFGEERRCLHDLIADTIVVDV